jgi:hypothetical protein
MTALLRLESADAYAAFRVAYGYTNPSAKPISQAIFLA